MTPEAEQLLSWYRKCGRVLPWRGPDITPYAVWVSEIMLQQTTVKTVCGYFEVWMKRFPTLQSLADSSLDEVLLLWQGLGYYTRAKKMHACAREILEKHAGVFPRSRAELLKLPGIGPYTASSICAFAFNLPETVVDGNVIRVIARYYGMTEEVDRDIITPFAEKLTPQEEGGNYASAIMDLGATVCTPKTPDCSNCPWQKNCIACKNGIQDKIPLLKKTQKKQKTGAVFILTDKQNRLFIRKRPGKGLLSGLWELPWTEDGSFPIAADWENTGEHVRHVFTHIDLTLQIYKSASALPEEFEKSGIFVPREKLSGYAFSTLMKKVLKTADILF